MHLDKEDIDLVLKALEEREQALLDKEHAHPARHPRSIKRRLLLVVVVIVTMAGADRVIHIEWAVRVVEMSMAAFFDWFFNVARAGEMALPKVKLRRKTKAPTAGEGE